MSKSTLETVILALNEAGYNVVGCVSDLGGGNMRVWMDLAVTSLNPNFPNPCDKTNIWVFADVPNLLKLLKDHFLHKGFLLSSGTVITKVVIQSTREKPM